MNANFSLIPVNDEAGEKVSEVFSQTVFGNVNTFIAMFNAGFLNRSHDENKDYSELVERSYGNVYKNKNLLVVQSPAEYQAGELASIFDDWKTITRLRREINEGVGNNELTHDTVLYIGTNGVVYTVNTEHKQIFSSKIGRVNKESVRRILSLSTVREGELELEEEYREDEYSENSGFSLDSDSLVISEEEGTQSEDDTEEEAVDLEGKELPDNAATRSVKASDIVGVDDSFIEQVYNTAVNR